ncbi:hypothetical protein CkaCkLH20_05719 [Colletotrichum karsti]|uniref:Uncharacterized protein n=1 Tax=Colletotrichum karsti TaxID=1095194 RepID=A0A9P6I5Q0_9PEZI|nr:uncharacterized protein CkaCkLH20_05719 [Colletotrichum karsti]KAF9876873.1 hypothetical protein CkaCkLH20_05719 [Colletotrichum karsti]
MRFSATALIAAVASLQPAMAAPTNIETNVEIDAAQLPSDLAFTGLPPLTPEWYFLLESILWLKREREAKEAAKAAEEEAAKSLFTASAALGEMDPSWKAPVVCGQPNPAGVECVDAATAWANIVTEVMGIVHDRED